MKEQFDNLIYSWYSEYREGFISNQEIFFSREYLIKTNYFENKEIQIEIRKNKDFFYPSWFYGENITSLTAIVGENGSGKTTIAQMLFDCPLPGIKEMQPFFWIVKLMNGSLKVYYYKKKPIIKTENASLEEWQNNDLSLCYLTNIFNIYELDGRAGRSSCIMSNTYRKIYSPAYILVNAAEQARKTRYGYFSLKDNKFLTTIQHYADLMEKSEIKAYIKKQEELIIECYKQTSDDIKKELCVFNEYDISIVQFPDEEGNDKQGGTLQQIKENYSKFSNMMDENQYLKAKMLVYYLSEFCLCFGDLKFDTLNTTDNCINVIKQCLRILSEQEECPWMIAMKNAGETILKWYEEGNNWKTGRHYFKDSDSLIEWYYDELKRNFSFFKRYLSFSIRPISSGELAMINLFSYIVDSAILPLERQEKKKTILIIDEIDMGLHPRWQQNILHHLLRWLNSYKEYSFQIILTSHSPIVLSDILMEDVIKLCKESQGKISVKKMDKLTFGTTISKQILDTFYMDKGNIGSFSKEKIKEIIKRIAELDINSSAEEIKELKYLVNSIGEELVRKKLLNDINKRYSNEELFLNKWREIPLENKEEALRMLDNLRK